MMSTRVRKTGGKGSKSFSPDQPLSLSLFSFKARLPAFASRLDRGDLQVWERREGGERRQNGKRGTTGAK